MKGFREAIISGECEHWSQDLGASLGFGALAPRGKNIKAERPCSDLAPKAWAALRSF